jgi:hypothetical protein
MDQAGNILFGGLLPQQESARAKTTIDWMTDSKLTKLGVGSAGSKRVALKANPSRFLLNQKSPFLF